MVCAGPGRVPRCRRPVGRRGGPRRAGLTAVLLGVVLVLSACNPQDVTITVPVSGGCSSFRQQFLVYGYVGPVGSTISQSFDGGANWQVVGVTVQTTVFFVSYSFVSGGCPVYPPPPVITRDVTITMRALDPSGNLVGNFGNDPIISSCWPGDQICVTRERDAGIIRPPA